jgi:hypothetical protein
MAVPMMESPTPPTATLATAAQPPVTKRNGTRGTTELRQGVGTT